MFDLKTKVLIIDDMMTMRKLVGKVCREIGFQDIIEAADGAQGWEQVCNSSPGLIISDWNMPNCTGIDLLKRVRGDSRFKNLPFLLVTAETEQVQVAEALKADVDNYVVKPFTKEGLTAKLEDVHKKRGG